MPVNIELLDDLDAVGRQAAGALDRASRPSLFDRLHFFRLIAEYCPPPGKPLVLSGQDGASRGWLFLAVDGSTARSFTAWYSLRFNLAGEGGTDVLTAMAAALRDGGIAKVELAPLEDGEPFRRAFQNAGWWVSIGPKTGNWRAATAGMDFDTYWATRPGRLRNTAKRRAKAVDLDIQVHDRFSAEAWADYETVYRASWKPEEGSFPFLRALAEQEGAAGTLRLGIAKLEGSPVAAQLWLVENQEATIHKLAYAEASKAFSPGTLLSVAMFRHVLDKDKAERIDYGNGDEPYKADWMDERRDLWQLTAYNPRTFKGLAGASRAALSKLVGRMRTR